MASFLNKMGHIDRRKQRDSKSSLEKCSKTGRESSTHGDSESLDFREFKKLSVNAPMTPDVSPLAWGKAFNR